MNSTWFYLRENIPYSNHILFPSLIALFSFHSTCWFFTFYDYFILKRGEEGIRKMLWECALPQTITHIILNILSFYYVDTRITLPIKPPTTFEFISGFILCFIVGDFLIYWEHVLMHRLHFLRKYIHSVHHRFTYPLYSYNAGWVHPFEIFIAALCELAFPLYFQLHPFIIWTFLYCWVFWLVEEHSGDELFWSLSNILPQGFGGGAEIHQLHHSPLLTKNYGFVFAIWDHLFSTFSHPISAKNRKNN